MSEINNTSGAVAQSTSSRRAFLRGAAVAVAVPAVAGALAACKDEGVKAAAAGTPPQTAHADSDHSGGTMAAHPRTPAEIRAAADDMDKHHEAGIKSFPAPTQGRGTS